MTLSSAVNQVQYTANGSTTDFAFPYYFLLDGDIVVVVTSTLGVDTTQVITTHYTLTGAGVPGGGTVSFVTDPLVNEIVTITRVVPFTQLIDYVTNDNFPAETHEKALDKAMMGLTQINEVNSRTLKAPQSEPSSFDPELPATAARLNKFLKFDSSGDIELSTAVDLSTTDEIILSNGNVWVRIVGDSGARTVKIYLGISAGDNALWVTFGLP